MQQLSPMLMLAAAHPLPTLQSRFQELAQRSDLHSVYIMLGAFFLFDLLVGITCNWIVSKLLASSEKSTFVNAIKLWGSYVILAICAAVGLFFLAMMAIPFIAHNKTLAWEFFWGAMLFLLAMVVVIAMNIYQIGFFRAVAFVVLCVVLRYGGTLATKQIVLNMPDVPWLAHSSQALAREMAGNPTHFANRLSGKDAPDQIDWMLDEALVPIGPTPPLRERQAMVTILQQKLQERKATFPPGLPPPPAFQNQMDRYTKFLNEVKADMAQPRPQGTASTSSH
jgi:hypothetical protein